MKHLITAAVLVIAMAVSTSAALANNNKWYGQNTNATISDVVWNGIPGDYRTKNQNAVNGVNGYDQYNWGNGYKAQSNVHSVDKSFDLDLKKHPDYSYYGYELNCLHMDFDTAKKGDIGGQIAPTRIQAYIASDFSWGGYANKNNPVVGTLGTYIDFYYMETATGTLVYTVGNSFKMGSLTQDGEEYFFYAVNDMSKLSKSTLEGDLYDQALANLGGVPADAGLYGLFAKPGKTVHFKFDIIVTDRDFFPSPPAIPIPGAAWLMGTGLAGLAAMRRHRR